MEKKFEMLLYKNDPFLFWLLKKRRLKPYQLGIITFLFGFGIMSLWYWLMVITKHPDANLRGLYGYYSSGLGDSIILPLLSFLIANFYIIQEKLFLNASIEIKNKISVLFSKKIWIFLTFLFAGLVVYFFHLFAIYGKYRNWTLPKYGVLNAPGWYHGAFMFFQIYLVAGYCIKQIIVIFLLLKHAPELNFSRAHYMENLRIVVGILISIGIFGGLLAADRINTYDLIPTNKFSILINEATVLANYLFGMPVYIMLLVVAKRLGLWLNCTYNIIIPLLIAITPVIIFFIF